MINEPSVVCQGNLTRSIDQITHHVSCSLARKRLPKRSTSLSPSGHPSPPFSSHRHHLVILDYNCARRQTRKRISMQRRRQSFTRRFATTVKSYHVCQTINVLPDVALLEIFAFVVDDNDSIDAWHPLVHVCQKWRNIVFGSPRRLNLQLHCTAGRP